MNTANQASNEPRPTLEQQRAQDAWKCSENCSQAYMKLAKGLPAMIMNSGLMQVMAFLHEKGQKPSQKHCEVLGKDLRTWLHGRFGMLINGADFKPFMQSLMVSTPSDYQAINAEALAWLKWLRQMSAAVAKGGSE